MLPRPIMIGLTLLIALVWTGNVIIGVVDPVRHDPSINALFALVVGAVFALGRKDHSGWREGRRKLAQLIAGAPERDDTDSADRSHEQRSDSETGEGP